MEKTKAKRPSLYFQPIMISKFKLGFVEQEHLTTTL